MEGWSLESALEFIRELEQHLQPHYHVGLTGSVLYTGVSEKDLDIMIFPHCTEGERPALHKLLTDFDMRLFKDRERVIRGWRSAGSQDNKIVEIWKYKKRRIDVFYLFGAYNEDRKC